MHICWFCTVQDNVVTQQKTEQWRLPRAKSRVMGRCCLNAIKFPLWDKQILETPMFNMATVDRNVVLHAFLNLEHYMSLVYAHMHAWMHALALHTHIYNDYIRQCISLGSLVVTITLERTAESKRHIVHYKYIVSLSLHFSKAAENVPFSNSLGNAMERSTDKQQ